MSNFLYIIPAMGIIALIFMALKSSWVTRQNEGSDKMKEIAKHIADGAMAFLKTEYKVLTYFVIIAAILLGYMGFVNPK